MEKTFWYKVDVEICKNKLPLRKTTKSKLTTILMTAHL